MMRLCLELVTILNTEPGVLVGFLPSIQFFIIPLAISALLVPDLNLGFKLKGVWFWIG